jgi:hypothetical protein
MLERLRSKEAATISAVLALGLGVTACGGGGSSSEASSPPVTQHKGGTEFTYNKDGSVTVRPNGFDTLEEFCQGTMLIAESYTNGTYGGSGSVAIEADSPYCADGKLIPGDFQLSTTK